MSTVLLVIHLFITLALIGVVLIQRSEGGGLGIGSSQGMGSFMTGRGTANLLTRTTAVLATIFMGLSLALALLNKGTAGVGHSILDVPPAANTPANKVAPAGLPVPPVVPHGDVGGQSSAPSPAPNATLAPATAPAATPVAPPAASAPVAPKPAVPTN